MAQTKIQSEQIEDSAVVTDRIGADAVTTAKIADNVGLGGNPTTTTQTASDNTTKVATTAYVTTAVANLIDSAPGTLNTLNEIAAALNDDANFNTTVTNAIAAKLPLAGGTMTGNIVMADDTSIGISDSAERIEFDGAGDISFLGANVGIGTDSPTDPLVVQSSGSIGGGATNANSYFTVTDGTYGLFHDPNEIFSDINGSFHIGANHSNGLLRFHTGGTDTRMIILANGNVGIGETSPNEPLTIRSSSENVNTVLLNIGNDVHASNTKDAWIRYESSTGGSADQTFAVGASNNSFRIVHLGTRATAPHSGTEIARFQSDGDVKIGNLITSATTAPLFVAKSSTDVQAIFGDNNSSIDDPSIRIIGRDTANSAIRYSFFGLDADANHGFIGYNAGAGGFVNALSFDTSGNVTFAGEVKLADDKKITLGASDDIQFKHHNSGYGHLENAGTLYIDAEVLSFRTDNSSIVERLNISAAGAVTMSGDSLSVGSASLSQAQITVTGTNSGTNPAATGHMASSLGLSNGHNTDNSFSGIDFNNQGDLVDSRIVGIHKSQSSRHGEIAFLVHNGSALTERMRLTKDGFLGIGTTNPVAEFAVGGAGRRIEIGGGDGVIRGFDRTASWTAIDFEASGYTFDVSTQRRFDVTSSGASVTGTLAVSGIHDMTSSGAYFIGNSTHGYRFNNQADSLNLVTIYDGGDTKLWHGNLIFATAGKGIDFSATDNFGVSTPSELLDDYEEGTWTPLVTDGTNNATMYTSAGNGGKYTKIGRAVTFTAQVTVQNIASVGANAYVSGLPLTNGNSGANRATAAVGYGSSLNITAGRALTAYVELNQQNIILKEWSATTGTAGLAGSQITDGGTLFMSGTYYIN